MFNDREQIRKTYLAAWQKHLAKQPLSGLETQLVELILLHPEYQSFFENPDDDLQHNYRTDNNPFLHLGLHLGIREQLATNRPAGIREIFTKLMQKHQDQHQVEHLMMDVMANILWEAQQSNALPDEALYLERLKAL